LEIPAPRHSTPNDRRFPKALEALIARCLAKSPDERFSTVADLAAALAPFAPPEARLHADRAASITRGRRGQDLRASGWFPGPSPSSTQVAGSVGESTPDTEHDMHRDSNGNVAEEWRPRRRGVWLAVAAAASAAAATALWVLNSKPPMSSTEFEANLASAPTSEPPAQAQRDARSPPSTKVVVSVTSPSVTERPIDVRPVSRGATQDARTPPPRPARARRPRAAEPGPERRAEASDPTERRESDSLDPSPDLPPVSARSPVDLLEDDDAVRLLE
jgi:serine/threonine-protein kinase